MSLIRGLLVLGLSSSLGIAAAALSGPSMAQSLPSCFSPTNDQLLIDVELEQNEYWATWQVDPSFDASGNYTAGEVCVAPIEPTSGMLRLDQKACPEGAHPRNRADTANGPEWALSGRGPEPFFSAYPVNGGVVDLNGMLIRKLTSTGGAWAAEDAPKTASLDGGPGGFGRVRPNIDHGRSSPRFHMREFDYCAATGCTATDRAFWRFDTVSSDSYALPDGVRRARWLEDSAVMAFLRRNAVGDIEVVAYSTVTGKEEIVLRDSRDKTHVLIFNAPEFGDRMTVVVNVLDPQNGYQLEVYVRAPRRWRLVDTIQNPKPAYPTLNSPEYFVLNGQSFISATSTGRFETSEGVVQLESIVWFASIDDGLNDPTSVGSIIVSENAGTQKVDPEPLVLEDANGNPTTALIYYVDTGGADTPVDDWRYLACQTGL